jgi:LacI family transcriptional regulator
MPDIPTIVTFDAGLPEAPSAHSRVTQKDVAHRAGVHHTTVSLALRNSPKIPEKTRRRLQDLAEIMGYRPDPTLRALISYRKSVRNAVHVRPLLYLTQGDTPWGWQRVPAQAGCFAAAQRRAVELGYSLDHLWLGEPGFTPVKLARILRERRAAGVLLATRDRPMDILGAHEIDWTTLAAVQIGTGDEGPAFNRVATNAAGVLHSALRHIREQGYKRIGLALQPDGTGFVEPSWSDVYRMEFHCSGATDLVPALILQDRSEFDRDAAQFALWHQQHEPDVIVGFSGRAQNALHQARIRIPRDVAYVELLANLEPGLASIPSHHDQLATLAVEMLVHQIDRNEFGPPTIRITALIDGVWQAGISLPAREAAPLLSGTR